MTTTTETPAREFAAAVNGLKQVFMDLYPSVASGEWVSWPAADRLALRAVIDKLDNVHGKIRPAFDKTVWKAQDENKLPTTLADGKTTWSIRARAEYTDGNRPGRKAKTTEEIFDNL